MTNFNLLFTFFMIGNIVFAQVPELIQPDYVTHDPDTTSSSIPPTTVEVTTTPDAERTAKFEVKSVKFVKEKEVITIRPSKKTSNEIGLFTSLYRYILNRTRIFLKTPKVTTVLRNIATCVVNGAIELISYYFPAPLIPIIASAAGMLIPFEPVLMLRDRLPVTSYRRAFITALNSFLGTFDKYKLQDNQEYDPYMTQRFNRRMMSYGSTEKSTTVAADWPSKSEETENRRKKCVNCDSGQD